MKRLVWAIVGACAMAAIAVATSLGAGRSAAGPRDAGWGGGHADVFVGITVPRDFSLNVEQGRFGGADGSFVYGRNGVSTIVDAVPTCMAVSGNRAVIGGQSGGFPFVWYAVDNGKTESGTRDQITPVLLLDDPNDVAQMPTGFPNVCPPPDTPFNAAPYADVTGGDIVIRDVS
jgi:hypothetical protein